MNKRKKIIMVRHGETIWNTEKRIQGHSDTSLTEYGIQQAEKTEKRLSKENLEEIYSSDLGRAVQTAEIINKHLDLNITLVKGLRERKYGILEGLSFSELNRKYPDIKEKLVSHDPEYKIPGGESLNEFTERTLNCINKTVENTSSKTILLVVHGGVLECFFYRVIGLPLKSIRKFSLFNTSINIFSLYNEKWNLDSWGITDHLEDKNTLSL